jgi:hypothetical protein
MVRWLWRRRRDHFAPKPGGHFGLVSRKKANGEDFRGSSPFYSTWTQSGLRNHPAPFVTIAATNSLTGRSSMSGLANNTFTRSACFGWK